MEAVLYNPNMTYVCLIWLICMLFFNGVEEFQSYSYSNYNHNLSNAVIDRRTNKSQLYYYSSVY